MRLSSEQTAAVANLSRQMFTRVEALSRRQKALEEAVSRCVSGVNASEVSKQHGFS